MAGHKLEALIQELPPDLQEEVMDFAEFLLQRRGKGKLRFLRQDWAGTLRDFRERYTAAELQEKALQWRGD